ncbi:MAG: hypothetical protein IIV94_00695 [Clostridiales bacterium]|nr:hypothetical protein [Clostridiales bacterium]
MTDKEKAIVMAHTGICMLQGDKFQIFHKYIEDIMGRPIMTHEIGFLEDTIKEKTKADFIALCADDGSSENQRPTGQWIDIQYFKADDTYYRPKCPFCGIEPKEYSNYCPNCGADMTESKPS